MDLSQYKISVGIHKGNLVIWIQFPYSRQLKDDLKKTIPLFPVESN